jgi:hypothetical protein
MVCHIQSGFYVLKRISVVWVRLALTQLLKATITRMNGLIVESGYGWALGS